MKPNKKLIAWLPFILALMLLAGMLLGNKLSFRNSSLSGGNQSMKYSYDKIPDLIRYIEHEYVDSVNKSQLTDDAIAELLKELDPHSQYIRAVDFHDVTDPLMGNFEGIGVQFQIQEDTILVLHTIAGGPSEKVGIKAGDRIVTVADSVVASINLTSRDVVKLLKGPKGSDVKVGIARRGINELLEFTITRDVIPTYSIDISYMPGNNTGYIKLSRFSMTTQDEFDEALSELRGRGMEKLILDLRGNTGGYLQSAIHLADEFLDNDKLIVYTEGRNRPKQFAYASRKGQFENQPLVILIDESSASASEIVAGAVQDNDRGLIIGRRSFGKGLVQEELKMMDGSAVRLTVARYYTPTGRCIQKPYNHGNDDYYLDFHDRFASGELQSADSVEFNDSLRFVTPGGKVVYGGGGIMPDIFIPIESGDEFKYFNTLVNKGLIYRFAMDYTDRNRRTLEELTFEEFDEQDNFYSNIFSEFLAYTEKNNVQHDAEGIDFNRTRILLLLKAYVARNIYNNDGFYPVYHRSDKGFLKAMEVLQDSVYAEAVHMSLNNQ